MGRESSLPKSKNQNSTGKRQAKGKEKIPWQLPFHTFSYLACLRLLLF
ncbi:hypothetical protein BVRB_9g206390 isoform B [Beta vulgaris subsp. vulgaris]|uniref:Uncharacterized protein n=1 Tax=Beta vulgaris subsp. vulgaris TaxID=3555 RepID=A0A0J8BM15_BETVV|nr:hypothetical protein BVRB_9g206390 isoform B [Beta vulgaris subsp. vulgaris]